MFSFALTSMAVGTPIAAKRQRFSYWQILDGRRSATIVEVLFQTRRRPDLGWQISTLCLLKKIAAVQNLVNRNRSGRHSLTRSSPSSGAHNLAITYERINHSIDGGFCQAGFWIVKEFDKG
jgi:hypothetical protein